MTQSPEDVQAGKELQQEVDNAQPLFNDLAHHLDMMGAQNTYRQITIEDRHYCVTVERIYPPIKEA